MKFKPGDTVHLSPDYAPWATPLIPNGQAMSYGVVVRQSGINGYWVVDWYDDSDECWMSMHSAAEDLRLSALALREEKHDVQER